MKFLARLIAVFALVVMIPAASAQEQLNPSDALRFFPDGAYRFFGVTNLAAMRRTEAYPVYRQIWKGQEENVLPEIAESLPERYSELTEYFAYAQTVGEKVVNKGKNTVEVYEDMLLLSIPGLGTLIEQDIKEQRLISTGKRLMKRPIYSLRSSDKSSCYVYATATDELLLARDPKILRAMVAADMGRSLRMIDNQEYADLFGYIGDFGQRLGVITISSSLQPALEKSAEEIGSERLEKLKTVAKVLFEIENVFLSDEIIMRTQDIFTDEETAKYYYATLSDPQSLGNQHRRGTRNQIQSTYGFLMENQKTSLEGVIITRTIHLDPDALREFSKWYSAQIEKEKAEEK